MRSLRETSVLLLLALLPFHALGVTVLTRIFAGPNNAPLAALALWKEALLAIVLLLACVEFMRTGDRRPEAGRKIFPCDAIDACIIVVAASLFFSTFLVSGIRSPAALYGIRYDLVPLGAFLVLRRVPWSGAFLRRLPRVLGWTALVAVAYGLLTLVLPASFFTALGYSDLHSLYVPSGPVAPFQQIGGTALRRMQGAMSGPNQFGIWLAMVLPVILALGGRWRRFAAPLVLLGIALTFSRAAWIAATAVMLISFWPALRKLSAAAVTALCVGALAFTVAVFAFFPSVVLRIESSADHLRNPIEALGIMISEPLGRGLGSAGPAHNRVSDACVFLEAGSDASWAAPHADLCVFVGDAQAQPVGKECSCPLLPENWYLQLGVEGGWVAMLAFMALVILSIRRLWPTPPAQALMAVGIAGLFLHAWEDAAVAYAAWMLCAVTPTFRPSKR